MGRQVTLNTLKETVRQRLDLPTFSTSTFVSTATVEAMLNASLQTYYGLCQELDAADWYTYQQNISTVPNQGYVDVADKATLGLSVDFVNLRALYWVRNNDALPVQLDRAEQDSWGMFSMPARAWDGYKPRYALMRQRIYFFPVPAATYALSLWYTGAPADLVAGTDTFEGGPGWEEYVVADVCAKIRDKEDDAHSWLQKREAVVERMKSQLERDRAQPASIRRQWDSQLLSTRERYDRATYEG